MHKIFSGQNTINKEKFQRVWWGKIHLIAAIGLFLRLLFTFLCDTIYHPDEIFQYVEQAHRWAFGYGSIPWEYRYGIRSWILPGFIAGLLKVLHTFNIEDPNIYTAAIKVFFCIISIFLIYSSYIITRNIATEKAARIACLLTCFWYELVSIASKAIPEMISAYLIMGAILCLVTRPSKEKTVLFGLACGLITLLRYQYLGAVIILFIAAIAKWKKQDVFIIFGILFSFVLAAGYLDYLTWGSFFASYYNNFLFNSTYKVSELFGVEPPWHYFLGGAFISTVFTSFLMPRHRRPWLLIMCIFSIILPHSLIAHKEFRFILAVIPLCLILAAITISDVILNNKVVTEFNGNSDLVTKLVPISSLYTTIKKIRVKLLRKIQQVYFDKEGQLVYSKSAIKKIVTSVTTMVILVLIAGAPRFQPTLSAYLFLHKEPDLVALFNKHSSWGSTGGYYYLHRNIPIYYPNAAQGLDIKFFSPHVSHIICHINEPSTPGFTTIFKDGDLEVRRTNITNKQYRKLDIDTINFPQKGVDDRFKPTVKPHIKP
jgi:GPI mannosyltransferase 3